MWFDTENIFKGCMLVTSIAVVKHHQQTREERVSMFLGFQRAKCAWWHIMSANTRRGSWINKLSFHILKAWSKENELGIGQGFKLSKPAPLTSPSSKATPAKPPQTVPYFWLRPPRHTCKGMITCSCCSRSWGMQLSWVITHAYLAFVVMQLPLSHLRFCKWSL